MTLPKQPTRIPALKRLHDEHLFCHAFSHTWENVSGVARQKHRTVVSGVYIVMRCGSCKAERRDVISPFTGQLLLREYRYPENYSIKVDKRSGTKKEQMRREYLARRG